MSARSQVVPPAAAAPPGDACLSRSSGGGAAAWRRTASARSSTRAQSGTGFDGSSGDGSSDEPDDELRAAASGGGTPAPAALCDSRGGGGHGGGSATSSSKVSSDTSSGAAKTDRWGAQSKSRLPRRVPSPPSSWAVTSSTPRSAPPATSRTQRTLAAARAAPTGTQTILSTRSGATDAASRGLSSSSSSQHRLLSAATQLPSARANDPPSRRCDRRLADDQRLPPLSFGAVRPLHSLMDDRFSFSSFSLAARGASDARDDSSMGAGAGGAASDARELSSMGSALTGVDPSDSRCFSRFNRSDASFRTRALRDPGDSGSWSVGGVQKDSRSGPARKARGSFELGDTRRRWRSRDMRLLSSDRGFAERGGVRGGSFWGVFLGDSGAIMEDVWWVVTDDACQELVQRRRRGVSSCL
mmetsp:Transcript_19858/g.64301  ORF Transcript_19858/g.64301 Transcript_19858/m.64301 type:complete len:414 (-) Transcript_19858:1403-2644(-)